MSYINSMKATEDILTLVESWDEQNKTGLETSEPVGGGSSDSDPFGTVSLDDINNTVETDDNFKEPENLLGDAEITLTAQEKAIVRENLANMLAELKGDDVSDVALEVIIGEVAKNSAVLTEADENTFETPAEKSQVLDEKEKAIDAYIRELLQVAAENDGVLPAEGGDETPSEENPETPSEEKTEEKSETPAEEKTEEKAEKDEEKKPESEAVDSNKEEIVETVVEEGVAPVEEGTCTECDQSGIVEVPEEEVIRVVDDSEVEPVEIGETPVGDSDDGKYATKEDVEELKNLILSLGKSQTTVLEAIGLIKGADVSAKNMEGGTPSMGTPKHSSAQKTAAPAIAKPGFKIATLKNLTDAPTKPESNAPFGKENDAEVKKSLQFKKGEKDQGKSQTEPEGGIPGSVTPKKAKETPAPTDPVKAAVVRESVTGNPTKTWLAEAAKLIRGGK